MTQHVPMLQPPRIIPNPNACHAVAAAAAAAVGPDTAFVSLPSNKSDADLLSAAVRSGAESVVYAADLGQVARQLQQFRTFLPNVTPYYAVKCNPDPVLLAFLARLGVSFDCASSHEISLVSKALCQTSLTERIIFANPFKPISDLTQARLLHIDLMTFDSTDELEKIAKHFPSARLLLRIAVEDSKAKCPLSGKFGAHMSELDTIFDTLCHLGLNLLGVSFHVGSGCTSVQSYVKALQSAHVTFNRAKAHGLPGLRILDIGGGFPGYDGEAPITFREIAAEVRAGISTMFNSDVRIIAEPGRFFATAAYTLGVEVVLATELKQLRNYYLADGVFGCFRDAWLLNVHYPCDVLIQHGTREKDDVLQLTNLYGPTRDVLDVISRNIRLPLLNTGDWLRFPNMGAYTMSLSTRRSGFNQYKTIYYIHNVNGDAELEDFFVGNRNIFTKQIPFPV